MKAGFSFIGLNLNIIIQEKTPARFMDYALKTRSIKNIETLKLCCCLPSEENFWLRAWLPLLVFIKILWFVVDVIYLI